MSTYILSIIAMGVVVCIATWVKKKFNYLELVANENTKSLDYYYMKLSTQNSEISKLISELAKKIEHAPKPKKLKFPMVEMVKKVGDLSLKDWLQKKNMSLNTFCQNYGLGYQSMTGSQTKTNSLKMATAMFVHKITGGKVPLLEFISTEDLNKLNENYEKYLPTLVIQDKN